MKAPESPAAPPSGFRHDLAMKQMRENCARDLPWFIGSDVGAGKQFVVAAGGPSLRTSLAAIATRQKDGACVLACNGAANFMIQNGINPDIIAFLDISPVVTGFIPKGDSGALYLVCSCIHPSVLDALSGRRVVLWHADYGEGRNGPSLAILDQYPGKPSVLVGGGNTIAMRAQILGHLLGFREVHYYGLDSSFADDGADHAYVKQDGHEPQSVGIKYRGRTYRCSPWMALQAKEFEFYYNLMRKAGTKIYVHGDGLIPQIWRTIRHKSVLSDRLGEMAA